MGLKKHLGGALDKFRSVPKSKGAKGSASAILGENRWRRKWVIGLRLEVLNHVGDSRDVVIG